MPKTDLDTRIVRTIRNQSSPNHPLTSSEIAEIVGEPPRTVRHHLNRLEKREEIILLLRRNDKERGYVSATQYREWEDQKYEVRKAHSDDLKPVLADWMKQMPHVTWNEEGGGDIIEEERIVGDVSSGKKLQVELHPLFPDLEHHLDPTVFDHWNRMKDLATKIPKLKPESEERSGNLKEFETLRDDVLRSLRTTYWTPVLPGVCRYLLDN